MSLFLLLNCSIEVRKMLSARSECCFCPATHLKTSAAATCGSSFSLYEVCWCVSPLPASPLYFRVCAFFPPTRHSCLQLQLRRFIPVRSVGPRSERPGRSTPFRTCFEHLLIRFHAIHTSVRDCGVTCVFVYRRQLAWKLHAC